MTTALFINIIVLAVGTWVCVFKVIPACRASFFRNRLWELRDQLVDDIRRGEFVETQSANNLLAIIELAIDDAEDVSALNFFTFEALVGSSKAARHHDDPLRLNEQVFSDAQKLRAVLDDFELALLTKVFFGSPSGWAVSILSFPIFVSSFLWNRWRKRRHWLADTAADRILDALVESNAGEERQPHRLHMRGA
jgi:hypothetical protein